MKNLGTLIQEGYDPKYEECFYRINEVQSTLVCDGRGFGQFNIEYYWSLKNPQLDQYYLHPYFPQGIVHQVQLLQDVPGSKGRRGTIHDVHNDFFVLYSSLDNNAKWITYTIEWIYEYPTYFRPIYL